MTEIYSLEIDRIHEGNDRYIDVQVTVTLNDANHSQVMWCPYKDMETNKLYVMNFKQARDTSAPWEEMSSLRPIQKEVLRSCEANMRTVAKELGTSHLKLLAMWQRDVLCDFSTPPQTE